MKKKQLAELVESALRNRKDILKTQADWVIKAAAKDIADELEREGVCIGA